MKITFYGASEGVTGSNYLVEAAGAKFIVDCGLFQGGQENERKNWEKLPYNPQELDFALITHSHIDHIGRLPLLSKAGFHGKIHSTEPVAAFSDIFLHDTCKLLKGTADDLGLPELYEPQDVTNILTLFATHKYYEAFQPAPGIEVKFYDAGHILGSAIIEIKADGKTLVFSGDLGNPPVPILRETDKIPAADYVVIESTYGDRNHDPSDLRRGQLEKAIEQTIAKKGVLLMPSFAMERTQEIIYEIHTLMENGQIPRIPIYLDSPLAIKATEIYEGFEDYFDKEAKAMVDRGDDFFKFPGLTFVEKSEDSKRLDAIKDSKIIIAGSGMSNGGRILFHEKVYLPDPSTTLLIVGYQVEGTPGRKLHDGMKEVHLGGEEVQVRATVESIESYSAHADQKRLLYWLSEIAKPIQNVFITHGETPAKETLLKKIQEDLGQEVEIPKFGETREL